MTACSSSLSSWQASPLWLCKIVSRCHWRVGLLPKRPFLLKLNQILPFSFLCSSQFLLLQAFQTYSDDILSSETNVRIDPTSGPRLITRRRNLSHAAGHGRGDFELSALDPDLENDDFFVRRTGAFHANPCVLRAFEDFRRLSEQDDPVERDIILQCREGELVLPDLEKDDMIVRRIPAQKKEVPLSGAPDRYQPVPVPDPWTLPPEIQAKFLCVLERTCPPREKSPSCRILVPSFRRKDDDMLTRKIRSWKLGTSVPPVSFTPGPCSEADLQKWEAIREASRRRHKKRLMVERSECVSARVEGLACDGSSRRTCVNSLPTAAPACVCRLEASCKNRRVP